MNKTPVRGHTRKDGTRVRSHDRKTAKLPSNWTVLPKKDLDILNADFDEPGDQKYVWMAINKEPVDRNVVWSLTIVKFEGEYYLEYSTGKVSGTRARYASFATAKTIATSWINAHPQGAGM